MQTRYSLVRLKRYASFVGVSLPLGMGIGRRPVAD